MNAKRSLIYSQVSFFAFILLCFTMSPNQQAINDGVSYFGVNSRTFIFDALAFGLSGYFFWQAASDLSRRSYKRFAQILRLIVILMPGVLLTPYTVSSLVYGLHVSVSSTIFILELLLVIWLAWRWQRDWINGLLVSAQIISGLLALVSLNGWLQGELWGQLLFQLAFSFAIIRITANLPATRQLKLELLKHK